MVWLIHWHRVGSLVVTLGSLPARAEFVGGNSALRSVSGEVGGCMLFHTWVCMAPIKLKEPIHHQCLSLFMVKPVLRCKQYLTHTRTHARTRARTRTHECTHTHTHTHLPTYRHTYTTHTHMYNFYLYKHDIPLIKCQSTAIIRVNAINE